MLVDQTAVDPGVTVWRCFWSHPDQFANIFLGHHLVPSAFTNN
jgi:hypothetical protein